MGCKFIRLGENSSAIICGHKDHICNSKGPEVYSFIDGDVMTILDKLVSIKASPVILQSCKSDQIDYLIENGYLINGASVSCSICGSSFQHLTEH